MAATRLLQPEPEKENFVEQLIDVQGVPRLTGLSESTVRRWIRQGNLPVIRVPGCDRVLIDPRDLRAVLDAGRAVAH
jgi:excisionase family DNA binding protein